MEKRAYKTRNGRNNGATVRAFHIYLDEDLVPWLKEQGGNSRYINELVRRDMEARSAPHIAPGLGLHGNPSALAPDAGDLVPPSPAEVE